MKKLLLGLGAITAIVTPVAAVVACGTSDTDKVLDGFKEMNIKTVNNSKMSDADKTAAIKDINGAKDVADLSAVMAEVAKKPGFSGIIGTTETTTTETTEPVATVDEELTKGITVLNTKLVEAVKNTVDTALAADPEAGKYTEVGGMALVAANAADWNIKIEVVTKGFVNADNTYYTSVARDGYTNAFTKPMLSYKDDSMGLPIAVELNDAGIEKFFADYAHGGLSLGNKETGADKTSFQESKKLVEEFIKTFSTKLA